MRSREIMDAVERGESFVVTRDGREIGELVPRRKPQRFVTRADFARGTAALPRVSVRIADQFLADIAAASDDEGNDPLG